MGGEDAMIAETVCREDANHAEAGPDKMNVDKPLINSLVFPYRSVEFEGDVMVLDNVPPRSNIASVEGLGKEVNLEAALGFDNIPKKILDKPDVKAGDLATQSSSMEVSMDCRQISNNEQKGANKQLKRKRVSVGGNLNLENKESYKSECQQELAELFEYFKEVSGLNLQMDVGLCCSINSLVAVLLEEQGLPFSKLVEEIYDKLKGREGLTLTSVRGSVLLVGQRIMYGILNADADVLEDDSESCLWCWETRDLKLLPACFRGVANIRRFARKKINERISAISEMLTLLSSSKCNDSYQSDLLKASKKLGKLLNEQAIRSLVEKMKLKSSSNTAGKEAKLKEKESLKEIEKSRRSAEKEKKKIERELLKEKLQNEKEMKRMREEAEREEKQREREDAELKRQLKKQQEEAARDQRRREKEEAVLKKQLSVQKQASIMGRFLKSKTSSNDSENSEKLPIKNLFADASAKMDWVMNSATSSMDSELSQPFDMAMEDLRRLYVASWQKLVHCNRSSRWGVRRNPKSEIIKEIKLQRSSIKLEQFGTPDKKCSNESSYDRLVEELEESFPNNLPCQSETILPLPPRCLWRKKLLQFDKSNRPAYYGTWRKKSGVVGPRYPFKKDPELDYDVDSDEEWEEEDPGESLSDCDKDNEECLDEESLKNQVEDESEDDFVVPDGYLSENEGVEIEASSKLGEDEQKSSLSAKSDDENEEFRALLQQQKFLHSLTEKALRKNQALVIANLNHGKDELITAEDLIGKDRIEQICMQALCMRAYPGNYITDISVSCDPLCEEQEVSRDTGGTSKKLPSPSAVISDSDLPEFVKLIQSCPRGMNKVVEVLHQKFSDIPKSQLRNKVRETSDFVDNHWEVKKNILERLGLPVTPDKKSKPKGIAVFFSKRCLPPKGESSVSQSSLEQCSKANLNLKQNKMQSPENAVHTNAL